MSGTLRSINEAKRAVSGEVPGHHTNTVTGEAVFHSGLTPKQVPKAWARGLQAAGIDAKVAKVFRNGNWTTLPLVIEVPCPREHVDDSRERFARVRLRVEPSTGWITIHEDSCSRCTQSQIEVWLLTCPRCVSDDEGHAEHGIYDDSEGDESPIALVLKAMYEMAWGDERETEAKAKTLAWTRATAVEWLDALTKDGVLVVSPKMGQAAAWDAVRETSGHPPQALVREAQAERKGRASSTA